MCSGVASVRRVRRFGFRMPTPSRLTIACVPALVVGLQSVRVPAAETTAPTLLELRTLGELQARLYTHVGQPRFASALWGVKVVSLASGRVWFEHDARRLLSPASNTKLYTGEIGRAHV